MVVLLRVGDGERDDHLRVEAGRPDRSRGSRRCRRPAGSCPPRTGWSTRSLIRPSSSVRPRAEHRAGQVLEPHRDPDGGPAAARRRARGWSGWWCEVRGVGGRSRRAAGAGGARLILANSPRTTTRSVVRVVGQPGLQPVEQLLGAQAGGRDQVDPAELRFVRRVALGHRLGPRRRWPRSCRPARCATRRPASPSARSPIRACPAGRRRCRRRRARPGRRRPRRRRRASSAYGRPAVIAAAHRGEEQQARKTCCASCRRRRVQPLEPERVWQYHVRLPCHGPLPNLRPPGRFGVRLFRLFRLFWLLRSIASKDSGPQPVGWGPRPEVAPERRGAIGDYARMAGRAGRGPSADPPRFPRPRAARLCDPTRPRVVVVDRSRARRVVASRSLRVSAPRRAMPGRGADKPGGQARRATGPGRRRGSRRWAAPARRSSSALRRRPGPAAGDAGQHGGAVLAGDLQPAQVEVEHRDAGRGEVDLRGEDLALGQVDVEPADLQVGLA